MSRYVLKLEAIGDGLHAWARQLDTYLSAGIRPQRVSGHMFRNWAKLGQGRAWVARVTGLDPKWKFARTFLYGKRDYTRASSTGNRGVYLVYFLEPGYYEINERVSWKNSRRYFAEVLDDDLLVELTQEELEECLKGISESTS